MCAACCRAGTCASQLGCPGGGMPAPAGRVGLLSGQDVKCKAVSLVQACNCGGQQSIPCVRGKPAAGGEGREGGVNGAGSCGCLLTQLHFHPTLIIGKRGGRERPSKGWVPRLRGGALARGMREKQWRPQQHRGTNSKVHRQVVRVLASQRRQDLRFGARGLAQRAGDHHAYTGSHPAAHCCQC